MSDAAKAYAIAHANVIAFILDDVFEGADYDIHIHPGRILFKDPGNPTRDVWLEFSPEAVSFQVFNK